MGNVDLSIDRQPTDETIPDGSPALFSVVASGANAISYQWFRDGQPVSGATQSSFTSQPVVTSDAGSTFSVLVSSGGKSLQSRLATLTIGPRNPVAGDLRFQQVGAISSSQEYAAAYLTNQSAPGQNEFPNQFGSPLSLGPGCMGVPTTPASGVYDCSFLIYGFSSLQSSGLNAFYDSDYIEKLPAFLNSINHSDTVVTGWSLNPIFDEYGASWLQGIDPSQFDLHQLAVPASGLAAALMQEGSASRVVTAVSFDGSVATLLSYGWSRDVNTLYDETAFTTTYSGAAATATQMAQQGYIVTAIGGSYSNGIILVGTKVHGDALPRPLLTSTGSIQGLSANGYAIVGFLVLPTGQTSLFIGEK